MSNAKKFGAMLKMLPDWNNLISYDRRNKYVFLHDVTDQKKAYEAFYYSKFLYDFRGGRYGRGRVLGSVYEHHYEYAFKTTAHTLQVWQNGKMIYSCTKSWLKEKTLQIRYNRYLYNKYGACKSVSPAPIAPHRSYTDEQAERKNLIALASRSLPKELFLELLTWPVISKSPYSNSFYNSKEIDWNYKPEGSLRISDHWNFTSRGEMHCETDSAENQEWACLQYHDGKYYTQEQYKSFQDNQRIAA